MASELPSSGEEAIIYLEGRVSRPSWPGGVDATSKKHFEASDDGADGVVGQSI